MIHLRGAHDHNLAGVDLDLDHGRWTAVVGVSGSGKTSLVFETLVREGRRRYLSALNPKARQFFGKLGRARVQELSGLPVPLAVDRRALTRDPRSTVGTQCGVLDLLRLIFAREARHPGERKLQRSHFSFNVPLGACPTCTGLGEEDRVDPDKLVADASRSIRAGALVPTLANGYTVYSQVTVDVMDQICRAHGFDIDTPWETLSREQRDVILYGTQALKVPFGKHALESRMKWEGITARPREEGYYRGLVPVIEEILSRGRNPGIQRFLSTRDCPDCQGTRLGPIGREAELARGQRLPELLALPLHALRSALDDLPDSPTWLAFEGELRRRIERLLRLDLGHLSLDRGSASLSGGEGQRLRLAAQLTEGLSQLLIALDEPTLGLFPESQAGLGSVLDEWVAAGNTLLVVEHDPDMVRWSDRVVALGPGAGPDGGKIVGDTGANTELRVDQLLPSAPTGLSHGRSGQGRLHLRGASLHNLQKADFELHMGTLHVVLGPSGAGKSSLIFGTLLPALLGEPGGEYVELDRSSWDGAVRAVDARPMGRSSRSNAATWSGLFDLLRKRFAAQETAKQLGLKATHFSFNAKAGRCPDCEGLGTLKVGLHLWEDAQQRCPTCQGQRYLPDVLQVTLDGANIAAVLDMSIAEAARHFAQDEALAALLDPMVELGIGHLALGTPSTGISSGEAQRIRLATLLASARGARKAPALYVFDEPDRGLHPKDIEQLLRALQQLVDHGHTVLAISHHRMLWSAADHLTEVRAGRTRRIECKDLPAPGEPRRTAVAEPVQTLRIRGARTHNLKGIDLDLPLGRWTSIHGASGAGKSSLAFGTVAAEGWRRFAESLPFQVRRFAKRLPRPEVDSIRGLTPVVALQQGGAPPSPSARIATATDLGRLLRLLWSRAGQSDAPLSASELHRDHPAGACPVCEGKGHVLRCDPDRLVTDPELSLAEGALAGTKAGQHFTEADGQHLATLRVASGHDLEGPWCELPDEVRRIAMEGSGAKVHQVTWSYRRGKRSGEHHFEGTWDGFLSLVTEEALRRGRNASGAAWLEVLRPEDCAECAGSGLNERARGVRLEEVGLAEAWTWPVKELLPRLTQAAAHHAAFLALELELQRAANDLIDLGLGAHPVQRSLQELSSSELQRLRLASVLHTGLVGTTVVLDEPDAGLEEAELPGLCARLRALCEAGNTLLVVTHRRALLEASDLCVELGPGAGPQGGQLLGVGPPSDLPGLSTPGAPKAERGSSAAVRKVGGQPFPDAGWVAVHGGTSIERERFLIERLQPALSPHYDGVTLGQTPRGRTLATALELLPAIQKLFHQSPDNPGLPKAAFSFSSPKGRCPSCKGSGQESIALDFLADLDLPCPVCQGQRYRPEVLEVRWKDWNPASFLAAAFASLPLPEGPLLRAAQAMEATGLGHLALDRSPASLSGGERTRLGLTRALLQAPRRALHLYLEPESGLAPKDLERLAERLQRLGEDGALVVTAGHRADWLQLADQVLELPLG